MNEELIRQITDEAVASRQLEAGQREAAERYARRVLNQVLVYCHRQDVPPALMIICGQITEDVLLAEGVLPKSDDTQAAGGQAVASITRGDTSISYREQKTQSIQEVGEARVAGLLKDYSGFLRKFKKPTIPRPRP